MNASHLYRFDRFEIDDGTKVLLCEGEVVQLKPKAVETLLALVKRPGEVVTKEELLDEVWPDAFVEESSLPRNIHEIRKILKELSEDDSEFIQTVPKAGYRFVRDVRGPESLNGSRGYAAAPADPVVPAANETRRIRWHFVAVIILASLLLTSFTVWISYRDTGGIAPIAVADRKISSLAVIPIREIGKSENGELIALGLTDTLVSRLGSLNRFVVRPYSSVAGFAGTKDVVLAGRQLQVDAVVEGTLQTVGNRYKVSLKLIDVRDGAILWARDFEETTSDIFKLQDALSIQAANSLIAGLTESDRKKLVKEMTSSDEAYLLYLKGREHWLQRRVGNGRPFFEEAIKLDPEFAEAHLALADSLMFEQDPRPAERALNKAIELDPGLEGVYATRGFIEMFHKWDWEAARRSFELSISTSPNLAKGYHWLGVYLAFQKRFDEADTQYSKALALDPLSTAIKADRVLLYYYRKQFKEADRRVDDLLKDSAGDRPASECRRTISLSTDPDSVFENELRLAIRNLKDKKGATGREREQLEKAEDAIGSADKRRIRDLFRDLVVRPVINKDLYLFNAASYLMALGDEAAAIEALERGLQNRTFLLPMAAIDPLFEPLYDEPRFRAVVLAMGLRLPE